MRFKQEFIDVCKASLSLWKADWKTIFHSQSFNSTGGFHSSIYVTITERQQQTDVNVFHWKSSVDWKKLFFTQRMKTFHLLFIAFYFIATFGANVDDEAGREEFFNLLLVRRSTFLSINLNQEMLNYFL